MGWKPGDGIETQVNRVFNVTMIMMIVMGILSLAASAGVIYLLWAAAQWLIANS